MLSQLETAHKLVGVKQSRRAIKEGKARHVFVADDAEDKIRLPLLALCREANAPMTHVPTMAELGAACGIEVGAAVAVIL